MKPSAALAERLFLGIDCSTQSMKAIVINQKLKICGSAAINFEKDLPQYNTSNGVQRGANGVVTSPTLLWVTGLQAVCDRLQETIDFTDIVAVSGSAQQHGSVYWKEGAAKALAAAPPSQDLDEALKHCFEPPNSPIWMDNSTTQECKDFEERLGGAEPVAELTGSRAYERFTGHQIHRLAKAGALSQCERVSLVSSFLCSLLLGKYASIDDSDGAGMNLMHLKGRHWLKEAVAASSANGVDVAALLGPSPVPSFTVLGTISKYFQQRYGFSSATEVVAFSGDNPNSLAGLGLHQPGDVGVSLGTSDTMFGITNDPKPAVEGHVFPNPTDDRSYMVMLCYKNGSFTRESIRDELEGGDWAAFSKALESSSPGNGGAIGFFFDDPEITPLIAKPGRTYYNDKDEPVDDMEPKAKARAAVEGQFLSMRLHGQRLGLHPNRVVVTGGGSQNPAIAQVLADVLQAPVYTVASADSAALGAAYRALHGYVAKRHPGISFISALQSHRRSGAGGEGKEEEGSETKEGDTAKAIAGLFGYELMATPNEAAKAVYDDMVQRYETLEQRVVAAAGRK